MNDLSLQGQFDGASEFRKAIRRIMKMRSVALRFGVSVQCHRNMRCAMVTRNLNMPQILGYLPTDERRALIQWMTRHGPFWEDVQMHTSDDYLACNGEIVTDTSVGEAAYSSFHGVDKHLISFTPSSWESSPINVSWVNDSNEPTCDIEIENFWKINELQILLQTFEEPPSTWEQLEKRVRGRFQNLKFSDACFESLERRPFAPGAARRIQVLLNTLNRFVGCFDEAGQRTPEGNIIYQEHFTGAKAWFSDSSNSEKNDFREKLTFHHPELPGETLFCSWHGKVKSPQTRIHFSWPIVANEALYVVYIGPKITKK